MVNPTQDMKQFKDQLSEKKEPFHLTANGIKEAAHHAGENLQEFISHTGDHAVKLRDNTSDAITKRPLTSAAIAFGAGALFAIMLRR